MFLFFWTLVDEKTSNDRSKGRMQKIRSAANARTFNLIKLRPREEVQPRIVRSSARKTQRVLRTQRGRLFRSRARARSLPCRSSLINRLVPRVHPPCSRNGGDRPETEKEEACPRIRPRIAVAAERREVSAVTFIGYKSTRILCRARVNTFMLPAPLASILLFRPFPLWSVTDISIGAKKERALFTRFSESNE